MNKNIMSAILLSFIFCISQNLVSHANYEEYRKKVAAQVEERLQEKEKKQQKTKEQNRLNRCENLQEQLIFLCYLEEVGKKGGAIRFGIDISYAGTYSKRVIGWELNEIDGTGYYCDFDLFYNATRWLDRVEYKKERGYHPEDPQYQYREAYRITPAFIKRVRRQLESQFEQNKCSVSSEK